jgi:polysaccharide biosynthesis protein PslJ
VHGEGSVRAIAVACAAALAIGVLAAASSPLIVAVAIAAGLVLGSVWWRPATGMFLFVGVVATLPFGVVPIPLGGTQLTFVDCLMLTTFTAVLARVLFGGQRLVFDGPATILVAFVVVACAAFVAAAITTAVPPELIRRVGKLLVSVLFFVIARSLLSNDLERVTQLTRWLMLAGAVQGAIGLFLSRLPPPEQLTLLARLQVVGYPTTEVLRYVPGPNNSYTTQLRAIGTSVDPNVFGGTLMLALALIVVQLASPRPVLPRGVLVLLGIPTAAGILLSLSRASWLGLACGLLLIGVLRYRRIFVLLALAGLALLATPIGFGFVLRFISGFSTADRATAFRLGEYSNAVTLIQRYPLLGIGFGPSPDIDVTAGVSSVYLLVAEQTGLLGLAVFGLVLASVWWIGYRGLIRASDQRHEGIVAAYFAAVSAALVTGLLDHYFANQAFPHAVALFWLYAAALVAAAQATCRSLPLDPESGSRRLRERWQR